jgi:hypothetical protein
MKYLLIITLTLTSISLEAQNSDPAVTKSWVDAKNYVFIAQLALPQGGATRPLTSVYDLTVRPDSIISFLPFFGRAYSAPIGQTDGGIKFTSTKFDYKSQKRKGKWEISIRPGDASDVQQIYLTIFENGSANLQINSINKQPISFTGYVKEGLPLNKKAF